MQKLTAAVQADDAPDLLIHTLGPGQLHFLDIIEDVDALEKDLQKSLGKAPATYQKIANLEGKWWAVPHFSRSFGFWVRKSIFEAAGINACSDLTDYQKLRDACSRVTNPDQSAVGLGYDRQPLRRR